jgi:hypothetical protein
MGSVDELRQSYDGRCWASAGELVDTGQLVIAGMKKATGEGSPDTGAVFATASGPIPVRLDASTPPRPPAPQPQN